MLKQQAKFWIRTCMLTELLVLKQGLSELLKSLKPNNWATAWKKQQNGMCAQRRLRSVWTSAQSDQSLRCSHEEALGSWLPIKRTTKTGGWTGWSESSLGAQVIMLFFVELWLKYLFTEYGCFGVDIVRKEYKIYSRVLWCWRFKKTSFGSTQI